MRLLLITSMVAALPTLALAMTVSYSDPFGASGTACALASCDVIGDRQWYDLDRFGMSFNPAAGTASISVILNFGPGTTLAPFSEYGVQLSAADIFFTVGGAIEYGLALTSHGNVVAGGLYQVSTATGVLSAADVLQIGSGYVYRPEFPVWLRDDGSIHQQATGSVNTSVTGDGYSAGRLTVSVAFTPTPQFIELLLNGSFGVEFAAATCGNDIMVIPSLLMAADQPQLPEPSTFVFGGMGLMVLIAKRYRLHAAAPAIRRVLRSCTKITARRFSNRHDG